MKKILIAIALIVCFNNISFSNKLDSGLVAFYPFNGNTNDESGKGNNGVNNGAVLTTDRFVNANKAYTFNHTYIEIPNSSSLQSPTTSFTLAFWTNISQWDLSTAAFMVKSNSTAMGQYGAAATSTPNVEFDLGGQAYSFSKSLNRNVWYFICFQWDGQKIRYYVNGSPVDSVLFSGSLTPDNNPLDLGRRTSVSTKYLRGKLDDIRIYNRALSISEIQQLHNENTLNITIIPQGLYNSSTQKLNMKDTVRLYIRGTVSPYQIIDSSKAVIDSVTFQGNFTTLVPPGAYYIAVRHRNSIETWSSVPVVISGGSAYDFTSSGSQAYGYNEILLGTKFCIYSGDENQDGNVDVTDIIDIYNAGNVFTSGYVRTDLTGDYFVDISDLIIAYNNAKNFVSVITPSTYEPPCNLTCDRMFNWSGFTWCVIGSNGGRCGPGPNYFSSSTDNVMVDSAGDLHLHITNRSGKYYCAELFTTQVIGYGSYSFSLSSRVDNLDANIVLGLFTWNDNDCVTNANSEIDIEIAKWGDPLDPTPLEYSVQPTNGGLETERFKISPIALTSNYSIHFFNWTPTLVSFSSYQGQINPPPPENLITSWMFDTNHPPKSKDECSSNPIIIPAPETSTNLTMNLWLTGGNFPLNNQEAEVIVHMVSYTP